MVFELASAQRRAGADVEIWTVDAIRAGSTERFEGLPIRYFYPDYALGLAKSRRMQRAFADLPKDSVLHSHCTYHPLNLQVGRAARRYGHRAFYHPHGALSPIWLKGWNFQAWKKRIYISVFEKRNLCEASGVFALTDAERADLLSLGISAPLSVLPNGIIPLLSASPEAGQEFRHQHGIPPPSRVILFIGRIVPLKRHEDILRAFASLRAELPDLILAIAGNVAQDPAYHQRLLHLSAHLGCAEAIRWLGFLDEQAKPAAFAAADIFVHASESEGMALAILEAMAGGLPVVATRGCYMRRAAEAGALIECGQGAESLAEALRRVLSDPGLAARLRANSRAYIRQEHDWDKIAAAMMGIYTKPQLG